MSRRSLNNHSFCTQYTANNTYTLNVLQPPCLLLLPPPPYQAVGLSSWGKFLISVQQFQLHVVTRICAASLIMYHRMVTNEFGAENAVATKLRKSAREANITDSRFPNTSPESLLNHWSDFIINDFRNRNPEIAPVTTDLTQMALAINQQSQMLNTIMAMMVDMRDDLRKVLHQERDVAISRVSSLEDEVARLKQKSVEDNMKLALLRTPIEAFASRRRSASELETEEVVSNRNKSPQLNSPDPPPASARTSLQQLKCNLVQCQHSVN